jgi:hypothetical protein
MSESGDRPFEEIAKLVLEYLQDLGYDDAELMADAGAGLYDIDSERAIVEVTVGAPPSRPDVQRLDGVARNEKRPALYFSARGFTASAKEWADNIDIALFSLDGDTDVITPVNEAAEQVAAKPPTREEAILAAAARAVESGREELKDEHILREADEATRARIAQAKERKALRRDLLG